MTAAAVSRIANASSEPCMDAGEKKSKLGWSDSPRWLWLYKILAISKCGKGGAYSFTVGVHLPSPFQKGWISKRAQRGFWTEEHGPPSFHRRPSHIVCYSVTSLSQVAT